jgi:hypothetical protein
MSVRKRVMKALRAVAVRERTAPFDLSKQIFLATLNRVPTAREHRITFARIFTSPTAPRKIINEHLSSSEFAHTRLANLMAAEYREFSSPNKIFFVHLPKASGTSLREQLALHMGFPSLDFYGLSELEPVTMNYPPFFNFWPLISGHISVHSGPRATHTVVTTVRQPQSRFLSLFRQQTRINYHIDLKMRGHFSATTILIKRALAARREAIFSHWLNNVEDHQLAFFANPLAPAIARNESVENIRNLPRRALVDFVSASLATLDDSDLRKVALEATDNVDKVSWSHTAGVTRLISELFPGEVSDPLPRLNDGAQFGTARKIALTIQDLERLQELSRIDRAFIVALQDQGKLDPAESSDEEELVKTANRLGFILP